MGTERYLLETGDDGSVSAQQKEAQLQKVQFSCPGSVSNHKLLGSPNTLKPPPSFGERASAVTASDQPFTTNPNLRGSTSRLNWRCRVSVRVRVPLSRVWGQSQLRRGAERCGGSRLCPDSVETAVLPDQTGFCVNNEPQRPPLEGDPPKVPAPQTRCPNRASRCTLGTVVLMTVLDVSTVNM